MKLVQTKNKNLQNKELATMSNESFHQPPVANGIEHGPYPHDGTPYSQAEGLQRAVNDALEHKRISKEQAELAIERVSSLALDAYDEEQDQKNREEADLWDEKWADEDDEAVADIYEMMRNYDPSDEDESDPWDREYEDDDEDTEDPLKGDVDRWVHPDETRTDAQIAHDERHRVEPYGVDGSDR